MNAEENRLLGEIKGKIDTVIDNQKSQNEQFVQKLDGLDTRLRKVETKAALNGAISGGLVAIGIALLQEKLKKVVGM